MALLRHRRPDVFDSDWTTAALQTARAWSHLDDDDVERLLGLAQAVGAGWHWEGLDGLEIKAAMRGHISTLGCLPILNLTKSLLNDVTSVIVAPTVHNMSARFRVTDTIVATDDICALGESLLHGPVRVAWDRVLADDLPGSRTSVVLHEFAHKIDMSDGDSNGSPPLASRDQALEFERAATETMTRVRGTSRPFPLRRYASTNRSELFAVATEAFFLQNSALRSQYPRLHRGLRDFYDQEPVLRVAPSAGSQSES